MKPKEIINTPETCLFCGRKKTLERVCDLNTNKGKKTFIIHLCAEHVSVKIDKIQDIFADNINLNNL